MWVETEDGMIAVTDYGSTGTRIRKRHLRLSGLWAVEINDGLLPFWPFYRVVKTFETESEATMLLDDIWKKLEQRNAMVKGTKV